jgi:hypothetical protein
MIIVESVSEIIVTNVITFKYICDKRVPFEETLLDKNNLHI